MSDAIRHCGRCRQPHTRKHQWCLSCERAFRAARPPQSRPRRPCRACGGPCRGDYCAPCLFAFKREQGVREAQDVSVAPPPPPGFSERDLTTGRPWA